jgi:hypothetical protein
MKPEEKEKLRQKLVEIYEGYTEDDKNSEVKKKAQNLFFEFVYATDSMDKDLLNSVNGLEHIGWEYPRSTKTAEKDWKMNHENAVNILKQLKK